jgi:hypothetical protein
MQDTPIPEVGSDFINVKLKTKGRPLYYRGPAAQWVCEDLSGFERSPGPRMISHVVVGGDTDWASHSAAQPVSKN